MSQDEILHLVATNTGTAIRLVQMAVRYWAHYPSEVDAEIDAADAAEGQAEEAWRRRQELLCRRRAVRCCWTRCSAMA